MAKGTDELIKRAVTDSDFRKRLVADPEGTLKAEGFEVTDEVLAKLRSMDADAVDAAAESFDPADVTRRAAG